MFLAGPFAARLDLGQGLKRRLRLALGLPRRPRLGRGATLGARRGVARHLGLEAFDALTRLGQLGLQRRAPPERPPARRCARAQPVLGHLLQPGHARRHQRRHRTGEQLVEKGRLAHTEVRQAVVVDAHPAADPAIGQMRPRQPLKLPRRTHVLQGRIKPQADQDRRVDRRPPGPALAGAYLLVKRAEVQPLDEPPHRTNTVLRPHQRLQVHRFQPNLAPIRPLQPSLAPHRPPPKPSKKLRESRSRPPGNPSQPLRGYFPRGGRSRKGQR